MNPPDRMSRAGLYTERPGWYQPRSGCAARVWMIEWCSRFGLRRTRARDSFASVASWSVHPAGRTPRSHRTMRLLRLSIPGAAALAACVLAGCRGSLELAPNDAPEVLAQHTIDAPDPGQRGPYDVLTLYYGSGTDRQRPEYRDSVAIRTSSVDASK